MNGSEPAAASGPQRVQKLGGGADAPSTGSAARLGDEPCDSWDWACSERMVMDLARAGDQGELVSVPVVRADGQRAGVCVATKNETLVVIDSEMEWDTEFEKAWKLGFTRAGRLFGLVRLEDSWTVAVDAEPWEERYDFAWNVKLPSGSDAIAVQVKSDMRYGVSVDGQVWETLFHSLRDYAISIDGKHVAATVQVESLPEADVAKFFEGTWSVAVDGKAWDRRYVNVWTPAFSADGASVAVQARTGICDYTVACDQKLWGKIYGCVWEPRFRPNGAVIAPVRTPAGWTLAQDGDPLWTGRYMQLWHQRLGGPDGQRVAAVGCRDYGSWTVVVDDAPWPVTFGDLVLPPVFSVDGKRVAATVKDGDRWTVVVDGKPWDAWFAMAWEPVISRDGRVVAAKVEKAGRYGIAVNGRLLDAQYDRVWGPILSPDGSKLLVCGEKDAKIYRTVVSVDGLGRLGPGKGGLRS